MRSDNKEFPDDFDEYSKFIVSICNYCQPNYGSMGGIVGYLYDSAKDAIRWHKAKPKEYINLIMAIGRLAYLSDEDFNKIAIDSDIEEMDLRTLNNLAIALKE